MDKFSELKAAAMACELLANREAQPVAVVISRGHLAHVTDDELELGTKLYTAPPAPAVPEEAKVGEMPFLASYVRGWNACRAAMLAQPVSSGYKLPDGWIACSEKMPTPFVDVIASDGKQTFTAHFIDEADWWCLVSQLAEEPGDVTHWMPLPAAPEGGNG